MLHYNFPYINHIKQLLKVTECNKNFSIIDTEDYTIINYINNNLETFPNIHDEKDRLYRECKGIAFDKDGLLISRPMHKFFEFGERLESATLYLEKPHTITELEDGVMITPLYLKGKDWRLATRHGINETSMKAEEFILDKPEYKSLIDACRKLNFTPIFEWINPKGTIILPYEQEKLVLIAVRNMFTGNYMAIPSDSANIPKLNEEKGKHIKDMLLFSNSVKKMENKEGYAINFPDGHRVTVRTNWYMNLDKENNNYSYEDKDIVKAVIEGKAKELLDNVPFKDMDKVEKFMELMVKNFNEQYKSIMQEFDISYISSKDRRDFSTHVNKAYDQKYLPFLYRAYAIEEAKDEEEKLKYLMSDKLLQAANGSHIRFDKFRWLIGNIKLDEIDVQKAA